MTLCEYLFRYGLTLPDPCIRHCIRKNTWLGFRKTDIGWPLYLKLPCKDNPQNHQRLNVPRHEAFQSCQMVQWLLFSCKIISKLISYTIKIVIIHLRTTKYACNTGPFMRAKIIVNPVSDDLYRSTTISSFTCTEAVNLNDSDIFNQFKRFNNSTGVQSFNFTFQISSYKVS